MKNGNVIIGQSGGPTCAINATLAGVLSACLEGKGMGTVYGARYGIQGILVDDVTDLSRRIRGKEDLRLLSATPSSALGSCRLKLGDYRRDETQYRQIFNVFKKYGIGYFFYIGGNDSMDTVAKLSAYAKEQGIPMTFMGVPKTIDNDLEITDHTPGFGSAAKYLAVTTQEVLRDCAVYKNPTVTTIEVMGRDAGWLTAASQLGRLWGAPTPDLVYLPEVTFDMDDFMDKASGLLARKPNVTVALSEGVRFADGEYVGASGGEVDSFGHKHLAGAARVVCNTVKKCIGCKARAIELSVMQRCSSHLASGVDLEESFGIGSQAVRMALEGQSGRMPIFIRSEEGPYSVSIGSVDVNEVVNKTKTVPAEHLKPLGEGVDDALLEYMKPLIQGQPDLPMKDGLPVHFEL